MTRLCQVPAHSTPLAVKLISALSLKTLARMPPHLLRILVRLTSCVLVISACNLSLPAPPTPLPSATPAIPQVEIRYPPHNQRVIEGVIFDIDILASDPAAQIQRVELYVDEALLQASESEKGQERVYRVATNWLAKGLGWHKFTAIAYRADGTASHPHVIALEVVARR